MEMPHAGGFSNPQFSEIDLDGDGQLDLFVFDRGRGTWRTFLWNSGWQYAPEYERHFPAAMSEFAMLRDANCDGHPDVFTYNQGGVSWYENSGSFPPQFSLVKAKVRTNYGALNTNLFTLPGDVPAITDVDADGDLDLLQFGPSGAETTIEWHQNQSMETYGVCDSLLFTVATQCWGGIEEPADTNVLEAIACKGIVPPQGQRHHPGSTLALINTDTDGDLDLMIGDILSAELRFAENVGTIESASISPATQTTDFPSVAHPVQLPYLVAAYAIDGDHNGTTDLVLAPNNRIDSAANSRHTWFYSNSLGSGTNYTFARTDFFNHHVLDLGSNAVPLVLDATGDGLLDLLVCTAYRKTSAQSHGPALALFENTGTAEAPAYTLSDTVLLNLPNNELADAFPTAGDLDGDGDLDLLIGAASGSLFYYENQGGNGPAEWLLTQPFYMGISSIGQNAAPHLADVNADGLLDLLVGERIGIVSYFENTGSAQAPFFSSTATIHSFGGIDVSALCCDGYAAPFWLSGDAYGGTFLAIATSEKRLDFYAINPDSLQAEAVLMQQLPTNAGRPSLEFADTDNDGVVELFVGTAEGGLLYFNRSSNIPIGIETNDKAAGTCRVWPNPTDRELHWHCPTLEVEAAAICDLHGRLVQRLSSASEVDVSRLAPGLYLLKLWHQNGLATTPLVVTE